MSNRISLSALLVWAAICAGCGGHFDTYTGPDAVEPRRSAPRKTLFPQVHFVGAALPGFTVIHKGRLLSTFDDTEGIIIFAVADRHGTRDLVPWVDYISRRYGRAAGLLPVINLNEEHWFKKYILRGFIAGTAYTLYYGRYWERRTDLPEPLLDWSGRVQRALALSGHGPFVVVANDGRIVGFFAGRAVPERIQEITGILDKVLPVRYDVEPPAVPEPFTVGGPEAAKEAVPIEPGPQEDPLDKLLEPAPGREPSVEDILEIPEKTTSSSVPEPTVIESEPAPEETGASLEEDVQDILESLED